MSGCNRILALIGFLIILCIVIDLIKRYIREGFASKQAIELCEKSKKILSKDDKISFTDFKYKTGCKDVVEYDGIKKLYKKGNLTPDNVEPLI